VPRNVHESNLHITHVEMSESQIDRNPSKLLFFEAIRIDSGQGSD